MVSFVSRSEEELVSMAFIYGVAAAAAFSSIAFSAAGAGGGSLVDVDDDLTIKMMTALRRTGA